MAHESSQIRDSFIEATLRGIISNPLLKPGTIIVRVDPRYFRPTEVETLLGDPSKARDVLGWKTETSFIELVQEMVEEDFMQARRDSLVMQAGFDVHEVRE